MKFIDEIEITVRAGKGGAGCVSFLREKYREHGGPDGGDGGRGGDVFIEANASIQSLGNLQSKQEWFAENGISGAGTRKTGPDGKAIIVQVPVGTEVLNAETLELICDVSHPDLSVMVAKGGLGGRGNHHFATSSNQTPEYAQPGLAGEELKLLLRLKLLADVGLVGLPNAGKSTLLAAVTHKLPRIADYAFTTLTPNIGVVEKPGDDYRRLLLADIPGIIEGASKGVGLGLSFLRHIERVRLIVYVLDGSNLNAAAEIAMLRDELGTYASKLLERPALVVINKMDQFEYDKKLAMDSIQSILVPEFWSASAAKVPEVLFVSAKEKQGTADFCQHIFEYFQFETLGESSIGQFEMSAITTTEHSEKKDIIIKH